MKKVTFQFCIAISSHMAPNINFNLWKKLYLFIDSYIEIFQQIGAQCEFSKYMPLNYYVNLFGFTKIFIKNTSK